MYYIWYVTYTLYIHINVINPLSQMIYYHVSDMLTISIWFTSVYLSDLQT